MPRKKKDSLGRSLIKDRFAKRDRRSADSFLHVAELNDGYDWGRLNLQSVTDQSSFQEFLSTAQLAGTEFEAEKLNIKFVNPKVGAGLLSKEEYRQYERNKEEKKDLLKIPRRPKWSEEMAADELQALEREEFLQWRRGLAMLQEEEDILLTPYEKNLDFWRQLWRVIERSDVVVQILDARNPLLFRCEDLEKYVKEVDEKKLNMLLLNKADFLTDEQRTKWAKYFDNIGMRVAFFSAKEATLELLEEEEKGNDDFDEKDESDGSTSDDSDEEESDSSVTEDQEPPNSPKVSENLENLNLEEQNAPVTKEGEVLEESTDSKLEERKEKIITNGTSNSAKLLGRDELVEFFRGFTAEVEAVGARGHLTIGLVGYPNVGKSSTINALLADKKVSVSATPGKTKHFQTLFLRKDLVLCDCPGLVMPSFASSKAEMILNGILPIDQMRDHVSPTCLLTSLIPRDLLQAEYGIMIPKPADGEDPDRPPTSEELLNAYAYFRGFMTNNGQPDNPRASRYILKDFVNGRLLYCVAPPGESQEDFHQFKKIIKKPAKLTPQAARAVRVTKPTTEDIDQAFFRNNTKGVHMKGVQKIGPDQIKTQNPPAPTANAKPWKSHKEKRNKKEKLRRVYRYLDE